LMKKLIEVSEKGYVTYDEINELLGPELVDTELYEEIMDYSMSAVEITPSESQSPSTKTFFLLDI
ncbi:MAG: RNA polymerase sigma factor region1.1 domain-containing protein, partial [Desulfurococcaceae archaeon]